MQYRNIICWSLVIAVGCAFWLFPDVLSAQDLGQSLVHDAGQEGGYTAATDTTFATMVGTAIRVVLSLSGVVFTVLAVYAGIMWMTAQGNDTQVESSKKTLQNAILGLLIALMAYSITGFVMRAFESASPSPGGNTTDEGGGGEAGARCGGPEDAACNTGLVCRQQNFASNYRCREPRD